MFQEKESEKKSDFSFEIVNKFSKKDLNAILVLEKKCFPEAWQYDDADEYYRKMLDDSENINIFLREGKDIIGYVLARFHNKVTEELKEYDPELEEKEDFFYIETIQILPEKRGLGGAKRLFFSVCEEAKRRGVSKFSIHARTMNGFSDKIRKMFEGKIKKVRKIESWKLAGGEPYEYIEWSY